MPIKDTLNKEPKNEKLHKTQKETPFENEDNDTMAEETRQRISKSSGNGAINKAQKIKQNFENRLNTFKERSQSPPIKQEYGESDSDFRQRQKSEDDESPDNTENRGIGDIAKQRLKTEANKQIGKAKNYTNRKLAENPRLANMGNKAKKISSRANLIKNKADEHKKRLKQFSKERLKQQAKKRAQKIARQAAKRIAQITAQIIQAAVRLAIQIIIAILSAFSEVIIILIVVVIIIVVIVVAIDYLCNDNALTGAACSAVSSIYSYFN